MTADLRLASRTSTSTIHGRSHLACRRPYLSPPRPIPLAGRHQTPEVSTVGHRAPGRTADAIVDPVTTTCLCPGRLRAAAAGLDSQTDKST